jgi:hypothetical protein
METFITILEILFLFGGIAFALRVFNKWVEGLVDGTQQN